MDRSSIRTRVTLELVTPTSMSMSMSSSTAFSLRGKVSSENIGCKRCAGHLVRIALDFEQERSILSLVQHAGVRETNTKINPLPRGEPTAFSLSCTRERAFHWPWSVQGRLHVYSATGTPSITHASAARSSRCKARKN